MTDQFNPLQFIESQIAGLVRFDRRLESVLANMRSAGGMVLASTENEAWECSWVVVDIFCVGVGTGPREAVLSCLEKAREVLGETKSDG